MGNRAYLSLGSNIDPETNMRTALKLLDNETKLIAVSSLWETEPVGFEAQANFLNAAALIETPLSAVDLKVELLQGIEQILGRTRSANKNAPRKIDLDIIFFNQAVLQVHGQKIPSPEIFEYAFVAVPMAEIAADYNHPLTGQTVREIALGFVREKVGMIKRDDVKVF